MRKQHRLSDVEVERYLLWEFPMKRMRDIKKRIEARGEAGRKPLDDIERSNTRFFENHSLHEFEIKVQQKLTRNHSLPRSLTFKFFHNLPRFVPVAALLAVVLVVSLSLFIDSPDGVRMKSTDARLIAYQSVGMDYRIVADEQTVKPGDQIQLAYFAGMFSYGAIVSIDGNSVLTHHLPLKGDESIELENDGEILLPYSFELDDAPSFERFYLILSDTPFSILDATRELPPVDFAYQSLSLIKEEPVREN